MIERLAKRWGGKRTRYFVYVVLLLLILGSGTVLLLIWYKPAPLMVSVAGSSAELAKQAGLGC